MPLSISKSELLDFVRAVEFGTVTLRPEEEPQSVYAGIVKYVASNGWNLAVFNDANEWDYFEWIETPDGCRVVYDELFDECFLDQYEPPNDLAWSRYGIPGRMKFRCVKCESTFKYGKDNVFLCPECRKAAA